MSSIGTAIALLYSQGLSQPEIARQLEVAPTTVSYHMGRIIQPLCAATEVAETPSALREPTRILVSRLIAAGTPHVEIARRLGISKSTVSYHARRLGLPLNEAAARRYDWEAVQRYYDDGHSVRACMREFGFSSSSWSDAVRRGAVVPRPSATPLVDLLVGGTHRGRHNLKLRLVKAGLKDERCERCGLDSWRDGPLTLALHHVNGERLDNRLENLELLCPNCHSQTDTFAGRNGRRRTSLEAAAETISADRRQVRRDVRQLPGPVADLGV